MKHVGQDCSCDTSSVIDGVAYKDCNGNSLPAGALVATCADIPSIIGYAFSALDASVLAQTTVSTTGDKTFKTRVKLSTAAGNQLSVDSTGLYAAGYNLQDCNGDVLESGTKVPTCDVLPVAAELSYILADGNSPTLGEDIGLTTDAYGSERFTSVVLSFMNSIGDELFAVDFTDMFNEVADEVLAQTEVLAGTGIYVTGNTTDGFTVTASLSNYIINVTDAELASDATYGLSFDLTRTQIRARGYSGLIVAVNTTTDCTIVCPSDSVVGDSFTIMQEGAGMVSVAARTTGTGTAEINAPSVFLTKTRETWSAITAICRRADAAATGPRWVLMGDLAYAEA